MNEKVYMRVSEAAKQRDTSRQAIESLIKHGRLTAYRKHGLVWLRRSEVGNLKDLRKRNGK